MNQLRFVRFVFFVLFMGGSSCALAQESSEEFWPEIDAWFRLSPKWRLSMYVPISKNLETAYREGNLVLQADYVWGKANMLHFNRMYDASEAELIRPYMIRGGFLGARSLNDKGDDYNEEMLYSEFHLRNPYSHAILISHRIRSEARWIGDPSQFSMRFRYRIMAEKEFHFKKLSLVPYVNVEPYFDTRYGSFNRVRAIGGATFSWFSAFAIETNFTYQHDTRSSITNLYALNIILHIFFKSNHKPKAQESGNNAEK